MQNSIGGFYFIQLAGAIRLPTSAIAVHSRAGVDGVTLIDDGKRGQPFALRSMVDAANYAAAVDEYDLYRESVGSNDVAIVWNNVDLSGYAKFHVLDVALIDCRAIVGGTGGLYPPSTGWLVAEWTLIASSYGE